MKKIPAAMTAIGTQLFFTQATRPPSTSGESAVGDGAGDGAG
jgi:hypothetical protein